MTPGEIFPVSGEIVLDKDRAAISLKVANTGDRPIRVGSRYQVAEIKAALASDRKAALANCLDIPAGTAGLSQRLFSEWLGTAFLLAAVVGSGVMAAKLAGSNDAVALLCNTLATGAIWVVLILVFGPISGAHFNPVVSLALAMRGALRWQEGVLYIVTQLVGGMVGVWAVHLMFELPLWQFSATSRTGIGQWLAEAIATFGLILTVLGCQARAPSAIAFAVGLYVVSASWFTASGSFANPAVTIARSLSDTFAGIAPAGVLAFIITQVAGMLLAVAVSVWLWPKSAKTGADCSDNSDRELT
jgi:glycerol uptake facilitator-like aquaporin